MDVLIVLDTVVSFAIGCVALTAALAAVRASNGHQKTIATLLRQQQKLILAVKAHDIVQAEVGMHNVDVDAAEYDGEARPKVVPLATPKGVPSVPGAPSQYPTARAMTTVKDGAREFQIFALDPTIEADFASFPEKEAAE